MWIAFAGSLLPWLPHPGDLSGALHEAESALIRNTCVEARWELPAAPGEPAVSAPLSAGPMLRLPAAGRLPEPEATVTLSGGFHRAGPLRYLAFVEYDEQGREDCTPPITGEADADRCRPPLGELRRGGRYRLELEIPWRHDNGRTGTLRVRGECPVRGENPARADIHRELADLPLRVIAYRESRFRQFDAAGRPLLGHPRGFGIMQLDTPPPSADQVWDWRANLAGGRALYAEKQAIAQSRPAKVRENFPAATDFTAEQLQLETYQRYNGGPYWRWDDDAQTWTRCARNDYADRCLAIELAVLAGDPPPEWE